MSGFEVSTNIPEGGKRPNGRDDIAERLLQIALDMSNESQRVSFRTWVDQLKRGGESPNRIILELIAGIRNLVLHDSGDERAVSDG